MSVDAWMSLVGPCPYRVNLRYTPGRAELRLTGDLTAASLPELIRLLDVLSVLHAELVVDRSGVTRIDDAVTAVLAAPDRRRPAAAA